MIIELTKHADIREPHIQVQLGFRRLRVGRFAMTRWPDLDTEPDNPCHDPAPALEPLEPFEGLSAVHQAAIHAARKVAVTVGADGASHADIGEAAATAAIALLLVQELTA